MPRQLIDSALERAEQSDPVVRAAALLHIARVMTAFNRDEATRILERGITLTESLPEPERGVMREQAVSLAGTVLPDRAIELAAAYRGTAPRSGTEGAVISKALFDMISHGHRDRAIQYVSDPSSIDDYPFAAAAEAIGGRSSTDDATRQRVLGTAIEAMRKQLRDRTPSDLPGFREFVRLFDAHWRVLPTEQARAFIRDLAAGILARPDGRMNGGFNEVRFSSTRQHRLFSILGPLRHLDPALTESLLRDHPQLAAAASAYPFGTESAYARAEGAAAVPPPDYVRPPDSMMVGRRLIPMPEAIATDFKEAFDRALRLYASEIDEYHPNDAPREFWPSTHEFRTILYKAGQHEGRAAIRHLDRIPDPDLQLFAQIELAAALAKLPQIGARSIIPGPLGFRGALARRARDAEFGSVPPSHLAEMPGPPMDRPNLPPSNQARIAPTRRARNALPTGGSGPDYWVIEGAPLKPVLTALFDVPATRVDVSPSLEAVRYDFALVLPRSADRETLRRLMREGVERQFHVTREARVMDVLVVTAPHGLRARVAFDDDSGVGGMSFGSFSVMERMSDRDAPFEGFALQQALSLEGVPRERADTFEQEMRLMKREIRKHMQASASAGGIINSVNTPMTIAELCELLEGGLDRPLIDETQLSETYELNVHSEATSTEGFLKVLSERLGLVVTQARRELEVLVVRSKSG